MPVKSLPRPMGKYTIINTIVRMQLYNNRGKQIVDYLHPPAYDYYGSDPTAAVRGCRALYDLKDLRIWSLNGHYNDPWLEYKF